MSFVSSPLGSSSGVCVNIPMARRPTSLPETGCLEVPHAVATVRHLRGWRRLSLTFKLSRCFSDIVKTRRRDLEDWVGRAWLAHSRATAASASAPDIGRSDNSNDVGMPSRVENWRSRRLVELGQRQEAKIEQLTRRAARRFLDSIQRQQFKVAALSVQAALRFVSSLRRPPIAYQWHQDPITYLTMCDPVKCNDGLTYDRWTIICHPMLRSPFTRQRPFEILVDDVNMRGYLFEKFPGQQLLYHSKRAGYKAQALQQPRSNPVEVAAAIKMLNNVLRWAPNDTDCQNALDAICSSISSQSCQSNSSVPEGRGSEVQNVNEVPAVLEGGQPDRLSTLRHRRPQGRDNSQAPAIDRAAVRSERSQPYVIPTIMHEDLVRGRYAEERRSFLIFLFAYMGLWFLLLEFQRAW
ncbi:unnamed protein product [Calypogeia fissa]